MNLFDFILNASTFTHNDHLINQNRQT